MLTNVSYSKEKMSSIAYPETVEEVGSSEPISDVVSNDEPLLAKIMDVDSPIADILHTLQSNTGAPVKDETKMEEKVKEEVKEVKEVKEVMKVREEMPKEKVVGGTAEETFTSGFVPSEYTPTEATWVPPKEEGRFPGATDPFPMDHYDLLMTEWTPIANEILAPDEAVDRYFAMCERIRYLFSMGDITESQKAPLTCVEWVRILNVSEMTASKFISELIRSHCISSDTPTYAAIVGFILLPMLILNDMQLMFKLRPIVEKFLEEVHSGITTKTSLPLRAKHVPYLKMLDPTEQAMISLPSLPSVKASQLLVDHWIIEMFRLCNDAFYHRSWVLPPHYFVKLPEWYPTTWTIIAEMDIILPDNVQHSLARCETKIPYEAAAALSKIWFRSFSLRLKIERDVSMKKEKPILSWDVDQARLATLAIRIHRMAISKDMERNPQDKEKLELSITALKKRYVDESAKLRKDAVAEAKKTYGIIGMTPLQKMQRKAVLLETVERQEELASRAGKESVKKHHLALANEAQKLLDQ